MMEHKKFWMVWNPNGRQPRYEHINRQSADMEAERLARDNPGEQFFVLKAVAGVVSEPKPVKQIKLRPALPDEIPF